jgi:hypothetical protein
VAQELTGFAGVRKLPVEDEALKRKAEDAGMDLVVRCIKGRVGSGIAGLVEELKAFKLE